MKRSILILFLVTLLQLILAGCSERIETPTKGEDSTIVYPSKSIDGIEAKITFCEKVSKKTGDPIKAGTVFPIKENTKVSAVIDLNNRESYRGKLLMFHVDWLDSSGHSLFKKRIDLPTNDSSSTLISSINISPDKRQPGYYFLRVYLFRELIAEKSFTLTATNKDSTNIDYQKIADNIKAEVTFCKSLSKKTGKTIGEGKVFTIKNKAKVLAIVNLKEIDTGSNQPLTFFADWIAPNDSSFYRKKFNISPGDSLISILSSISIAPEKRQPGNYRFRFYLFEKLITERNFELVKSDSKTKIIESKKEVESLIAKVVLCKKVSEKTGKPIGADTTFTIKEEAKVKAIVSIEKQEIKTNEQMKFYFNWIGPDGKSFYKKQVIYTTSNPFFTISNSISITPEKRQPGTYILRVSFRKKLIAEQKFELVAKTN